MLADAIRAEIHRLSRNRTALFWSVLFVPIAAFVLTTLAGWLMRSNQAVLAQAGARLGVTPTPLDLGERLVATTGDLAGGPLLLFVLIGAATVFAGDYRWETWRLIRARNRRANLILAKVAATTLLILAAMVALLVAAMAAEPIRAALLGQGVTAALDGERLATFLGLFGLGWLRIVQFMMISLLAAVLTRSLMAALFIPLVVGAAQMIGPPLMMAMGVAPDSWAFHLALPSQAFDVLKGALIGGAGSAGVAAAPLLKGWGSLIAWTLVPLIAALALFERQDLSKE